MSCPTCGNATKFCLDPRHNAPDPREEIERRLLERNRARLMDALLDAYEAAGRGPLR